MSQEFRRTLVGWLWHRVSHEVVVETPADRSSKGLTALGTLLPRSCPHMAVSKRSQFIASSWQEAYYFAKENIVDLSIGLTEHSHDMVTGFPWRE